MWSGETAVIARPGSENSPLRVAVIGAGPAGFYTVEALLKTPDLSCAIDIFDRLPTPYGLVRDGVAPDHPSIKKVTERFERVAADQRVRFFGNVSLGADVSCDDLRAHYHQVVYAVGARSDRRLGIPGEDLAGSHPATEFVAWYNGHPDYADRRFDLGHPKAVVVGNGNVAIDVARILVSDPDELAQTDIADHALEVLRGSAVREVLMLGRRGPAQAKFTSAELKELGRLRGVHVFVDPAELDLDEASRSAAAGDRLARRNLEILGELAGRAEEGAAHRLALRFLSSPVEILEEDGRVAAVRIERNRLVAREGGVLRSEGTGVCDVVQAGLVLRSVGYRGSPIPGVPFDEARAVIPNRGGRVTDRPGGAVVRGEYVAGWIKRGPTGIIGTNKPDGAETAAAMAADAAEGTTLTPERPEPEAIDALIRGRGTRYVTFADWRRLDEAEREAGRKAGRPRVKVVRVADMLHIMGL